MTEKGRKMQQKGRRKIKDRQKIKRIKTEERWEKPEFRQQKKTEGKISRQQIS